MRIIKTKVQLQIQKEIKLIEKKFDFFILLIMCYMQFILILIFSLHFLWDVLRNGDGKGSSSDADYILFA